MASPLNAVIGAAVALVFLTCLGLCITRRLVPELAWPMAPVVGWAVYTTVTLPVFLILPFTAISVVAVAAGVVIAAAAAGRATARPDATASVAPAWTYVLAALLALVPATALLPKFVGDAVYLADPIFDHAKVALVDEMMRFGLPPGNPFFADADHPRLAYYYLWHFGAAELALATGITGWEADIAMTWFSAFASLALTMGLAASIGGRAAAVLAVIVSTTSSARVALWWMFGAENVDTVIGRAAGFAGWLFQAAWVPQHIASATCIVAAVVLMGELARRRVVLLVAALALVMAAAFESSTWIGGITFAVAGPAAGLAVLTRVPSRQRLGFVGALALATIVAAGLAAPFLRDQLAATAGRGSPVSLQFYPVLGSYFSERVGARLDPPAFWLILLVLELPAVYPIGMAALAQFAFSSKLDRRGRDIVAALAALAIACLAVSWLLASTLAENNDLGWRAILPAVMALTALGAAGLSRWIAGRAVIPATVATVAILLGLPASIDLIHSDSTGRIEAEGPPFARSPELWAAVRRHAAADERVGNNPLFLAQMTPWPVNISWALLAHRRSCYAGRELAIVYTSLGPRRTEEVDAQFIRVFAGSGSTEDTRELAATYGCKVIVLTPSDGAWNRDPFAASAFYRPVEEKAEQWRIYRATD